MTEPFNNFFPLSLDPQPCSGRFLPSFEEGPAWFLCPWPPPPLLNRYMLLDIPGSSPGLLALLSLPEFPWKTGCV